MISSKIRYTREIVNKSDVLFIINEYLVAKRIADKRR